MQRPPTAPGSEVSPVEREPLARAMRHALARAVLLAAALVVGGLLFNELITLIGAGVITLVLAILFSSVAAPLERRGVPRPLGALAGVLLVLGVIVALMALLLPPMLAEMRRFADELPRIAESFGREIAAITGGDPERAGDRLTRTVEDFLGDPARMLGPVAALGLSLAGAFSAAVIMTITAFYVAAHPRPLVEGALRLFTPARRDWAAHVLDRLHTAWSGWLRGVFIDMAVTGLLLYAGLTLIGLEFAALFAVLSALLVVVPYFGAFAGGIPPLLLALSHSPEFALLTLGVYLIVQQIESNLIVPLVMARVVRLHPAVIAVGVVVVSQLFGLVGLFVAVPLISAATILVDELWVRPLEHRNGVQLPEPGEIAREPDPTGRVRRLLVRAR